MKRIILIILLTAMIMTGCKKTYLASIETRPIDYSNSLEESSLAISDDGIYFVEEGKLSYLEWGALNSVKLASLNYVDDKETGDEDAEIKRYKESFFDGSDLVIYDNWLYGLFSRENSDGSFAYSLDRIDLKGKNHEKVLPFKDLPLRFRIDSGKIYVYFEDIVNDKRLINTYDEKLSLISTTEYKSDEVPYGFYLEKGNLVIPENQGSNIIIYDNGTNKISYELINLPRSSSDSMEKTELVGIFKNGDKEYKFPQKIVAFASQEYFYVSRVSGKQTYEQYKLDGTLVKSISPSEFISSEGPESTMFWESDFSLINRVYNDRYIFGESGGRNFVCDIELESCRYLNE